EQRAPGRRGSRRFQKCAPTGDVTHDEPPREWVRDERPRKPRGFARAGELSGTRVRAHGASPLKVGPAKVLELCVARPGAVKEMARTLDQTVSITLAQSSSASSCPGVRHTASC